MCETHHNFITEKNYIYCGRLDINEDRETTMPDMYIIIFTILSPNYINES